MYYNTIKNINTKEKIIMPESYLPTIAAISTPRGVGGIAVIRISGSKAVDIADKIFLPKEKKYNRLLSKVESNKAVYGDILSGGKIVDDGISVVFRSPKSFTGEDVVEISCHGGLLLSEMVLHSALISGCKAAEAGEFTKRAFINGKISLTQAEAVAGLIDSQSEGQIKLASSHARGILSKRINSILEELYKISAAIQVSIDFPGEDLTELSENEISLFLDEQINSVNRILSTSKAGLAVARGIPSVIAGAPNTGKSSLLNFMLGHDRAIVSNIPGTTRDTIEETVPAGKLLLRLTDTAGLRYAEDEIENMGIARTKQKLEEAALVICVFDVSREPSGDDIDFINTLDRENSKNYICLLNKSDLGINENSYIYYSELFGNCIKFSCKNGGGYNELINEIEKLYGVSDIDFESEAVIANARQKAALETGYKALCETQKVFLEGYPSDIVSIELENAIKALSELDGSAVTEKIVTEIFSRFCVGK